MTKAFKPKVLHRRVVDKYQGQNISALARMLHFGLRFHPNAGAGKIRWPVAEFNHTSLGRPLFFPKNQCEHVVQSLNQSDWTPDPCYFEDIGKWRPVTDTGIIPVSASIKVR